jgi:octaprenyl-diphosphate synthase
MVENVDKLMREYIEGLGDSYTLSLYDRLPPGKRVRAKLILTIAGSGKDSVELASIIELIHAASLLHDDVIDDANQRRGVRSINSIYGDKSAIMLGDILYSKAFFELTSFSKEISKIVSNAVTMLSIGELLDVELSKEFNPKRELYFDMIYKKTAVLIEACSKSAAVLAKRDVDSYALYGKNLGLSFQIIDDILDITSDEKTLGKPVMNDFKEGKTTLPYIYLYEALDEDDKAKLLSLYKKDLSLEEIEWIKEKMIESQAIKKSYQEAKNLADDAVKNIEDERLKEIILSLIKREF